MSEQAAAPEPIRYRFLACGTDRHAECEGQKQRNGGDAVVVCGCRCHDAANPSPAPAFARARCSVDAKEIFMSEDSTARRYGRAHRPPRADADAPVEAECLDGPGCPNCAAETAAPALDLDLDGMTADALLRQEDARKMLANIRDGDLDYLPSNWPPARGGALACPLRCLRRRPDPDGAGAGTGGGTDWRPQIEGVLEGKGGEPQWVEDTAQPVNAAPA